jgi:hypothetical protein
VISIFYDLETSDRLFAGQILNYAFIAVGESYELLSQHCGKVKLSRLQLPSPEAILANRTDLLEHQASVRMSEREAMQGIWDYIADIARESEEPIKLVGYNSNKFDLPFLRTSLIRNGLSPYFEGRVLPADLLLASRKLAAYEPRFPRSKAVDKESGRLSLSLESLGHVFGLLEGRQSHESRDDVLLTIELAKLFASEYGLDIRNYASYEVPPAVKRGEIVYALNLKYEISESECFTLLPRVLLDSDHRSALWIDLERYKESQGRECVYWYSKATSSFFVPKDRPASDAEMTKVAQDAVQKLAGINLKNYFSKSVCDIEQDIYRLDFNAIEALRQAIWERDSSKLRAIKNPDADTIFDRHRVAHYQWGSGKDDKVSAMLREYALYRYGGRMHICKSHSEDSFEEGVYSENYHDTFNELLDRTEALLKDSPPEDRTLLESLKTYYLNSDIYRIAGQELLAIRRAKPAQAA